MMREESKEEFSTYLAMISNPMRKKILEVLSNFPSLPYLQLMSECHLSHPNHCGVFTYHLKKLVDAGALAKKKDEYFLTSLGKAWANMIEKMEGEYLKEKAEETEFDMDKCCPFCLEEQLRVKVTRDIIPCRQTDRNIKYGDDTALSLE